LLSTTVKAFAKKEKLKKQEQDNSTKQRKETLDRNQKGTK